MNPFPKIAIIGAGLAGCEAAWQMAIRGIPIVLFEMRPTVKTPAHKTGFPAELVCSNSFKSTDISNAHGLLKAEMEMAGSLIMMCAKENTVPAGTALAVDRLAFSEQIEQKLKKHSNIELINMEVKDIQLLQDEFKIIVIAGGPLLSDALSDSLNKILDEDELFFYDAIAPVVFTESINMDIAFKASRYDKGDADYINCPLNQEEYQNFISDLINAEKMPFKEFEQAKHFEGCLPVEVMAERGVDTLSFGPMKPVGLVDPRTNKRPWAVLQLRQENNSATLHNLVGCQTRMTWPEQKRVFKKIPGLEQCEFARMGSMHRNTFINAPKHLNTKLELKNKTGILLAGQLTGVEGYTESSAMGLWAAINIVSAINHKPILPTDNQTMISALVNYLVTASPLNFQPMNANFGLLTAYKGKRNKNKKEKRKIQAETALNTWKSRLEDVGWFNV